jgi:hypothetical protein
MPSESALDEVRGNKALKARLSSALDEPFIRPVTQKDQIVILLRAFSEQSKTLEWCCGSRILNRSRQTLAKYCRENSIEFSDCTPTPKAKN